MADPFVEVGEDSGRIREMEVVLPTNEAAPKLADHGRDAPSSAPFRDDTDAVFHRNEGLARDAPFDLASLGVPKTVAQEFAVLRTRYRTLRLVDAKSQLREESPKRSQHALACSL